MAKKVVTMTADDLDQKRWMGLCNNRSSPFIRNSPVTAHNLAHRTLASHGSAS